MDYQCNELYQAVKGKNTLIIGQPGCGKTVCTKTILLHELESYKSDFKVLVIDAEKEFIHMAKNLNGDVITFSSEKLNEIADNSLTVIVPEGEFIEFKDTEEHHKLLHRIFDLVVRSRVKRVYLNSELLGGILLRHIEEYKSYLNKVSLVVSVHDLDTTVDPSVVNRVFENILSFGQSRSSCEYFATNYGFCKEKLKSLKSGEYILKSLNSGTIVLTEKEMSLIS